MKRVIVIFAVALMVASTSLFADTSVLLDFSTLVADSDVDENTATVVDFSAQAGTGFTDEERRQMKTSLKIDNWEVVLASSSRTIGNQRRSLAKAVTVSDDATRFPGETVMGVRVHFPTEPFNSFALVRPPFEIPAYMQRTTLQSDGTLAPDESDRRGSKFDSYGVIKNVGVIKSITVNVFGNNFPNGFSLVLKDQDGDEQNIFFGYLDFDGWRELTWSNPNYIDEVRNREMKKYPLYPRAEPMRKLVGLVFYRDAAQEGGDFISYIKDITVTYDRAVLESARDIDEEEVWGILNEREESRRTAEFSKLGNLQVIRYLEAKKMHQEPEEQ